MADQEIEHSVVPLDQHVIFPNVAPNDNQACWYTAAMMVVAYRGIILPIVNMTRLPTLFRLYSNAGLGNDEDASLAQEVGLEHSPSQVLFLKKNSSDWFVNLSRLGPLLVSEPKHCLVASGIINRGGWKVVVADPWNGKREERDLAKFNNSLAWHFPIHYRRSSTEPPVVLNQPVMQPFSVKY